MNKLLSLLPFPIPSLANIQSVLVAFVIGALIGGLGGWNVKSKFVQASANVAVSKQVDKAQASTAKSNSVEKSDVEAKVDIQIRYKTITKEITKYVPQTTTTACTDTNGNSVPTTLSVGAVELLNSDTAPNKDVQSTSVSDGEEQAPTEVGLREMSEYILTIKQQYEELAKDHDSLVDYSEYYKNNIDK